MLDVVHTDNLLILQSSLMNSWGYLRHAFSSRKGGVSPAPWDSLNLGYSTGDAAENVRENRRRFLATLDADPERLACGRQVHRRSITTVERPGLYDACDGLITTEKNIVLAIKTADCVPLLLFDPVQKVLAVIHCGWRSVVKNIVEEAIARLTAAYSSRTTSIYAAIGPALRSCCYEIQEDVACHFSGGFVIRREGGLFLDLVGAIENRLVKSGVTEQNIDTCHRCTYCEKELFFSYRRDGQRSGRMMLAATLS
ncbi:MAG: peptidoglycan editing factor PgeF [Fidelibacterota bacterium]